MVSIEQVAWDVDHAIGISRTTSGYYLHHVVGLSLCKFRKGVSEGKDSLGRYVDGIEVYN